MLTCVRENIPAIAVVFNNGQWGAEKKNQIDYYADRYRRHQPQEPELRRHRRGDGRRTASRSSHPDEVGDALQQAIASGQARP